ncbi:MAG: LptF/LptG family permease [Nitrospiria bacterium]
MFQRVDRYILKELIGPFLLGILILTFILVMQQILYIMELVLDKGVDLASVGELFLGLLPSFFLITIPMAVLLSTVTTFNRLSSDNEIIAMYANGIGFFRLLRPVLIFSILVSLITLFMGFHAESSKAAFKKLGMKVLVSRASVGLEAGTFNGSFSGMTIYVDAMPTFSELEGVFIYDQRNRDLPTVIVAKKGILTHDAASETIGLHLITGSLQQREKNGSGYQRMVFANYDLKVRLSPLSGFQNASDPPGYREIKRRIADTQGRDVASLRLLSDFYKRFLFSPAAFVFCILGMPLGILSGRIAPLGGFSAGVGIIVLYYMLLTFGDYLISIRLVPPILAASLPILVFAPLCFYLFRKVVAHASPRMFGFRSRRP